MESMEQRRALQAVVTIAKSLERLAKAAEDLVSLKAAEDSRR